MSASEHWMDLDDCPIHGRTLADYLEDEDMASPKATESALLRSESAIKRMYARYNLKDVALDAILRESAALAMDLDRKGTHAPLTRHEFRTLLLIRDLALWGLAPTDRPMPVVHERNNETNGGE